MFNSSKQYIKKLDKDKQQLIGDYRGAFEDIIAGVQASSLTHNEEASLLAAILDDFLQAQKQGVALSTLVDGDGVTYYESRIAAYLNHPQTRIKRRWNHAANLIFTLTALISLDFIFKNIIAGLVQGSGINLHYEATLNFVIIWVIALGVVWYVLNNMKKREQSKTNEQSRSERTIMLLIMVSPLILVMASRTMRLGEIVVFSANGVLLLAILVLAYLICWRQSNR